jgi:hypothetical protein
MQMSLNLYLYLLRYPPRADFVIPIVNREALNEIPSNFPYNKLINFNHMIRSKKETKKPHPSCLISVDDKEIEHRC